MRIDAAAVEAGRSGVEWQHALQLWAGLGASRAEAEGRVRAAMEAAYSTAFERFERYTPSGPPEATDTEGGVSSTTVASEVKVSR